MTKTKGKRRHLILINWKILIQDFSLKIKKIIIDFFLKSMKRNPIITDYIIRLRVVVFVLLPVSVKIYKISFKTFLTKRKYFYSVLQKQFQVTLYCRVACAVHNSTLQRNLYLSNNEKDIVVSKVFKVNNFSMAFLKSL